MQNETTKPEASNAVASPLEPIVRPAVTPEMILEAAQQIAKNIDGDAATIAEFYTHTMDGYELARDLDRYAGWSFTMSDVEELDCMSGLVDELHRNAEKLWLEENDIQPPLPIGTRITRGVISGICKHSPARYLVKENGCTQDGRWLLVKYEDAKAA